MLATDIGVQTPRVHIAPESHENFYQDAVELSAAYGLVLDEWQGIALEALLGRRADGKWSCTTFGLSVSRQNGKTAILVARIFYGLVVLEEKILFTAQNLNTAKQVFRRILAMFEHDAEIAKKVRRISNTNGQEGLWLKNGGSLQFIARSKSAGRGFTVDLLICDEAQDFSSEEQASISPTNSASDNGQTILMGTPPGPLSNGEVFDKLRSDALTGRNPRVGWLEWSADPDASIDDVDEWLRANPAAGVRIDLETIMDERSSMLDDTFARERLGMWTGLATSSLFDPEHWQTLVSNVDPENPVAFAVDVSPERDMASIGVAGYIGDKVHIQAIEHRAGTDWVIPRLLALKEKWDPVAIIIDKGSPAGSLLQDARIHRLRVTETYAEQMKQACGSFYDLVVNGNLLHANQPDLNQSVMNAKKRAIGDAFGWSRKSNNGDITPLVACTLAVFGLQSKRKPRGRREGTQRRAMIM